MAIRVQPVILAGGAGTRLWPISNENSPKHLLEIVGNGSMLEQTLARVDNQEMFSPPIVVGAASQAEEVARLAPGLRLLLEPVPRGSAAAVALAAMAIGRDDVMLVLPSDHHIGDPTPLFEAVQRAVPVAREGRLVTFGIRPARAETGYGYITAGAELAAGVLEASSFIEKPSSEAAMELVNSGAAFWNSGMFQFTAGAFLEELKVHAPAIHEAAEAATLSALVEGDRRIPDRQALEGCPSTSIDYAVMEHSSRIAVVPIELDWSDVGNWAAVHDIGRKDFGGNVLDARSHAIGTRGSLLRSTGPKIVTIGLEDMIVVATRDHVLVAPLSEAQRVREAAELLNRGT
jgi:mannose-1-phosphate guanylyltransferase/mannose-1-phosphate guanylyltransferase/mannose-6-phosphate isomerase